MPPKTVPLGKSKKPAVQKQEERQTESKKLSTQIRHLKHQMEVIRLLDLGYSDAEIAESMALSAPFIQRIKDTILSTITPQYLQAVDSFRARQLARYERLYRVAEAMAIGAPLPERTLIGWMEDLPQKDWMKIALEILRDEAKLLEADLERAAKREEDTAEQINFTEVRSITMTRNNPLADVAGAALKQEWGKDPQEILDFIYEPSPPALPDDADDLLDNLDPREIHAQLKDLSKRLGKVNHDE